MGARDQMEGMSRDRVSHLQVAEPTWLDYRIGPVCPRESASCSEVPLREDAARTGFEVALEMDGRRFASEPDHDVEFPWTAARRV